LSPPPIAISDLVTIKSSKVSSDAMSVGAINDSDFSAMSHIGNYTKAGADDDEEIRAAPTRPRRRS
jgi:hypothetical protein